MATLRDMPAPATDSRPGTTTLPASPRARRLRDGRDLRLALGVGLVLVAVVLGSRVVSAGGDRTEVWALRAALASGTTLSADDLVAVPVALDAVDAYVATTTDVVGQRVARDVGAGELLPAAALAASGEARRLVTVPVDALHAPPGLARGERVDVYVTPKDGASVGGDGVTVLPSLVLAGALVADPGVVDESGASSQVGVVLDVSATDADRAVAAARAGDVDLVRVGA
ncbi:MAG TPA: SAF domain-containing protein [Candidatus Nanopelagicales bacterium]|nr:SAF domain-containing protein [Candidatus Nanopelagicales bacterium]